MPSLFDVDSRDADGIAEAGRRNFLTEYARHRWLAGWCFCQPTGVGMWLLPILAIFSLAVERFVVALGIPRMGHLFSRLKAKRGADGLGRRAWHEHHFIRRMQ